VAFTNINGIKIYYEIHGNGEPIVLLHHGFGCSKMWKKIYPPLIEKGYKVVMYDRRGYGSSNDKKDFKEFYVSDRFRPESVKELNQLMDFLQIDSFHLIGQCEGGVVAVDYAAKFPARVKTIVTSSTQCYSEIPMTGFNIQKFPGLFQELEPAQKQKFIEWHGKDFAEPFFNQACRFGGAYGKDVFDLRPQLSKVTCPALVLYPDRSFLFDVEQGVAFYLHLPEGELAVMPKCGHNTYEYRPKEYVGHVLGFLERSSGYERKQK
jgi:pimeloyl-ACP methyl ester carboxylesterase